MQELLPAPLALPQHARGQADGRRRHARRARRQRRALLPVPVAPVRALRSAVRVLHLAAPRAPGQRERASRKAVST